MRNRNGRSRLTCLRRSSNMRNRNGRSRLTCLRRRSNMRNRNARSRLGRIRRLSRSGQNQRGQRPRPMQPLRSGQKPGPRPNTGRRLPSSIRSRKSVPRRSALNR